MFSNIWGPQIFVVVAVVAVCIPCIRHVIQFFSFYHHLHTLSQKTLTLSYNHTDTHSHIQDPLIHVFFSQEKKSKAAGDLGQLKIHFHVKVSRLLTFFGDGAKQRI